MLLGRPKLIIGVFIILTLFIGLETYLHLAGFGSYPIYLLDSQIKYIPASKQSGVFLNRNHWFFNDRHMGNSDNWTPDIHPDVLLLGNSIVLGGNPYDHNEKLGPLLQNALGDKYSVWSVAAGGWTNINEMAYLDQNKDVAQNADIVVIEYMEGGLSIASPWPGYYVFPDHRPLLLSRYIIEKYALPSLKSRIPVNESGTLPHVGKIDLTQLERFTNILTALLKTSKVIIFFYPTKSELANINAWKKTIEPVLQICKLLPLTCVDVAGEQLWSASMYRDDDGVHPTVEGNRHLAGIIASAIANGMTFSGMTQSEDIRTR
jgi:lysophospholipase L1-like esterase